MPSTDTLFIPQHKHKSTSVEACGRTAALDAIADLPREVIDRMCQSELIDLIRHSEVLLLRPETQKRIAVIERATLMKLVYKIRQCVRQRGYGTGTVQVPDRGTAKCNAKPR